MNDLCHVVPSAATVAIDNSVISIATDMSVCTWPALTHYLKSCKVRCVKCAFAGAQSIAYYAGQSSAFAFAAAQADSITTCLLKATTSVDSTVQVSTSCLHAETLPALHHYLLACN